MNIATYLITLTLRNGIAILNAVPIPEPKTASDNAVTDVWTIIAACATILCVIFLGVITFLVLKKFGILEKDLKKLKAQNSSTQEGIAHLEQQMEGLKRFQPNIRSAIENLASLLRERPKHITPQPQPDPAHEIKEVVSPVVGKSAPSNRVYAGIPNDDYVFNEVSPNFIPGESLYVITFSGVNGRFELVNNQEALMLAKQSLSLCVERACSVEDEYSGRVSKIETITPGAVTKTSGGWQISKKAVVKYL